MVTDDHQKNDRYGVTAYILEKYTVTDYGEENAIHIADRARRNIVSCQEYIKQV